MAADRDDLQAIKDNKKYANMHASFHVKIEQALSKAKPGI